MITKSDCWKLYLVALEEIEKTQEESDIVDKIYQKAKELNL